MKVLITGAEGFIAKNLIEYLKIDNNTKLYLYSKNDSLSILEAYIKEVDFIFHLAGVNRPKNRDEFYVGNSGLTKIIVDILVKENKHTSILLSSSTQSELDNDYGKSKKEAEELLLNYSKKTSANIYIYKLENVFGKWSKPNYNSVIATWCYNITNDLEIQVNDKSVELKLVYIDDVIKSFIQKIELKSEEQYFQIDTVYKKTLGEISNLLFDFKALKIIKENITDKFTNILYDTYNSYK